MKYNFDNIINRMNTNCIKWDYVEDFLGTKEVIPLWVADMDFAVPNQVMQAIIKRAQHPIYGYTKASSEYYKALINWFKKRFNWVVTEDEIITTMDVVSSINFCIQEFSNEGDKIVIQTPVYRPFHDAVLLNKRKLIESPLTLKENHYEIDFEDFEKKISGAKLFILCSPHNPVGRVWRKEELLQIADICLRNNVLILSDEIHADLIFNRYNHIVFANISEEIANNTITFYSGAKTFNLAGLKTSSVIIKNKKLRKRFESKLNKMGLFGGNTLGYEAVTASYKYGEQWLEELIDYLKKNKEFITDYIKKHLSKISVVQSEGTYLLWLDFRNLNLTQNQLCKFLYSEAKVGLDDGQKFGKNGIGFMRMNIGCPRKILEQAMDNLKNAYVKRGF